MEINRNSTIIFVSQYAAPYEGNFILSFKALEQSLNCRTIWVFPVSAGKRGWMEDFRKLHTVYFTDDNLADSVHDLESLFAKYRPDIVHCNFDGYDIPVVKATRKISKDIHVIWHLHDHLGYMPVILRKIWQEYLFLRHYWYYGKNISAIAVSDEVLRCVNFCYGDILVCNSRGIHMGAAGHTIRHRGDNVEFT